MELNNIPTQGNWNDAASSISDNFNKVNVEVEKQKSATTKFKGYFHTVALLTSAVPSPKIGDTAWVGATYPGVVYDCIVNGTWRATTTVPSTGSVNLTGYIKQSDLTQTIGTSTTKAPSEEAVGNAISPLTNTTENLNTTVYGGIIDITPSTWITGYINTSGAFVVSGSYKVSGFIAVSSGQKYKALLSGSQNTLVVSGYTSNIQNSFITSNINIVGTTANPGNVNLYDFTIPTGVNYIRLGKHSVTDLKTIYLKLIIDASKKGIVDDIETILPLADNIPVLQDTLFGGGGVIEDLTSQLTPWITGHINTSGQLVIGSTYQVSSFVPVQAGKKYRFKASGSANVLLISGYSSNSQSSFVTSNINIIGNGLPKEEVVIIPNTVSYVRLCNHPGFNVADVYLKEVDSITEKGLVERVDVLEEKVSNDSTEFRLKRCAVFSIIADDALSTDPVALNAANEYNVPLSFAIRTDSIGTNGVDFYKSAYKNGSSILSHTVSHVANESNIIDSKNTLKGYGFPTNGYISPGGGASSSLFPIVDRYYGYANAIPNITSIIPLDATFISKFDKNVDPYRLTRIGLEAWNAEIKDCSKIFEMIDFAIANNLLVLMYIHAMPSTYKNSDNSSVLSVDNLKAICEYLANKRDNYFCKVLNTDQAVKEYYNYKDY